MNTTDEIPKLINDFIYARDHRLLKNEIGQAVVQLMQHGIVDDLVRSLIQNPVRKHKIAQAFVGPYEQPILTHGDLFLGIDRREQPIRFPSKYLNGWWAWPRTALRGPRRRSR